MGVKGNEAKREAIWKQKELKRDDKDREDHEGPRCGVVSERRGGGGHLTHG